MRVQLYGVNVVENSRVIGYPDRRTYPVHLVEIDGRAFATFEASVTFVIQGTHSQRRTIDRIELDPGETEDTA